MIPSTQPGLVQHDKGEGSVPCQSKIPQHNRVVLHNLLDILSVALRGKCHKLLPQGHAVEELPGRLTSCRGTTLTL